MRSIRDQCIRARVPFFFKQWGGRTPKAHGRRLDGMVWDQAWDVPDRQRLMPVQDFEPDGEYLPVIKAHSCEKIELHNYYAGIFTAGMMKRWPNLVYLGLYSGAGAATIESSGRTVTTSALSVLTQPVPFTHYIFVDEDQRCIDALAARAARTRLADRTRLIRADVNKSGDAVVAALPNWRRDGGFLTLRAETVE